MYNVLSSLQIPQVVEGHTHVLREHLHRLGESVPQSDEVAFPPRNDSSRRMDQAKALKSTADASTSTDASTSMDLEMQVHQVIVENGLKSSRGSAENDLRSIGDYAETASDSKEPKKSGGTHAKVLATVNTKHTTPVTDLIMAHGKQDAINGAIQNTIQKKKKDDPAKVQMKLKMGLSAKTTDDPENAAALRSRTDCYGKFLYKVHSVMHQTWFDNVMGLVSVARAGLRGGGGSVWGYQVWFP